MLFNAVACFECLVMFLLFFSTLIYRTISDVIFYYVSLTVVIAF